MYTFYKQNLRFFGKTHHALICFKWFGYFGCLFFYNWHAKKYVFGKVHRKCYEIRKMFLCFCYLFLKTKYSHRNTHAYKKILLLDSNNCRNKNLPDSEPYMCWFLCTFGIYSINNIKKDLFDRTNFRPPDTPQYLILNTLDL